MRYALQLILILLFCQVYGQNDAKINGRVFGPDLQALERATVSLISERDSLVLAYALTDNKGSFELVRVDTDKPMILFVSHVNSTPYQRKLQLEPGEEIHLDTIILEGHTIGEIAVTHVAPIRLNGDTLEYKTDYFKTRPNASVEELLFLLPGLQVNADGSIYYQGRQVSGVRVNDKDFFAQNLTIATRNLDASLIDVVQIIKDKGASQRKILDDSQLPIVINLKMKQAFLKADFGKFYGGLATRDRYEGGALLNTFRDTLQVSFIGFANNIGRQGFEYSELSRYGGFNRAENNRYQYYGTDGLMNLISTGINVNYDIAKKLKLNFMYNYEQKDVTRDTETKSNTYYEEIQEQARTHANAEDDAFGHELRGFMRYHFDSTMHVSYDGKFNFGIKRAWNKGNVTRWRHADEPVSDNAHNNNRSSSYNNYRQSLQFEKKFANKWLLSFSQSLYNTQDDGWNKSASLNRFYLFNDSLIDQERRLATLGSTFSMNSKINLQVPLGAQVHVDVYTAYEFENQVQDEVILNRVNAEAFENRNDIANNKGLKNRSFYAGTQGNFKLSDALRMAIGVQWLNMGNRYKYFGKLENTSSTHHYFLPNAMVSYKDLRFYYSRTVEAPLFRSIVVVDSDLYPTRYTYASPYFDNIVRNTYRMNYNNYFQKTKTSVYLSGRYTSADKTMVYASTYDTGTSFSTGRRYQAGKSVNYSVNLNLSQRLVQNNTWKFSISLSGNGGWSQSYADVNQEANLANQIGYYLTNHYSLMYKDMLTFQPKYAVRINRTIFENKSENFRNRTNTSHDIGATLMLNNMKKFRLETSYMVKNQVSGLNNQRQNLHIVNASVYYPMLKKGELKFSAFDILNQNISTSFGVYRNSTIYSSTLSLRQYFMLGFVYKFLKAGE